MFPFIRHGEYGRHFRGSVRREHEHQRTGRHRSRYSSEGPQKKGNVLLFLATADGGLLPKAADGAGARRGGAPAFAGVVPHPGVPLVQDVRQPAPRLLGLHEQRHGRLWREGRAQLSGRADGNTLDS